MGELIESIDPDNHTTYFLYDNFGRNTKRIHPDAGIDSVKYDLAGNIIKKFTQKNLNNQTSVDYIYNYSQLTELRYLDHTENNIKYFYGNQTAQPNGIGRICAIEDASGRQEIKYGKLGEVIEKTYTFVLPNETNLYTFKTSYVYDSWNRLLSMTYPDGEILYYVYNYGGNLKSMYSIYNNSRPYNYISNIKYNKFDQKTDIYYGNGTQSHYTYDNIQRLASLNTHNATEIFQNIIYKYDNSNNIDSIINYSGVLQNGLGGSYTIKNNYDDLYRLTSATGFFRSRSTMHYFDQTMSYYNDGRINNKQTIVEQKFTNTLGAISKNATYSYNQNQPHTISNTFNSLNNTTTTFNWDANGNMISKNDRFLCWDDENRLLGITDPSYTSYYSYDCNGNRFYKLTGTNTYMNVNGVQTKYVNLNNPTLYVEGFLVATPQGYTKHYYAGNERVASSIGLGGISNISTPLTSTVSWTTKQLSLNSLKNQTIANCLIVGTPNKTLPTTLNLYRYSTIQTGTIYKYYYHTNHLSSSSWISDGSGIAIQHLQNVPYGEDWVDERSTTWNSRYTFTGKEKDTETGYHYFGARYYDSDLSIWLSVDPMSDKYPSMSPYNYCANNPVILVDPDGKKIIPYGLLVHCGVALGGNSRLDQSITIGMYTVTPFYDSNKNLIGYNAGLFIRDAAGNETFRTDYQFAPSDLAQFKSEIKTYELAAKLIYSGGEPDWNSVSMGYNIMNEEFGSAFNDFKNVWQNALHTPSFWLSLGLSLSVSSMNAVSQNSVISNIQKTSGKTQIILAEGRASAFYKSLNPKWDGNLFRVDANYARTSFKTANGATVSLSTSSKSTGMPSVKISTKNHEIILRFPKY